MRLPFNGDFPVTQGFGANPEHYSQFLVLHPDGVRRPMDGHNGIDFGLPTGTPVIAPHKGAILEATFDPPGYGNYIKVESDVEGSVLAHLQKFAVQVGFQVEEGDLLGYSNNTGNSTGEHLHWGYYRLPRNRANGFAGFIDQEPLLEEAIAAALSYHPKFKIGDEIIPSVTIPVGSVPGKEDASYGKISPTAPAKVKGFDIVNNVPYYNIDQTYIGGGTGWARADIIDMTPMYAPTPVIISTDPKTENGKKTYSEAQYNDVTAQLEQAKRDLDASRLNEKTAVDRFNEVNIAYNAFVALGYTNATDVTNALQKKDDVILGVNKQLQTVLDRNAKLAKMVQDKENEDSTAIDEGLKALQELKEKSTVISDVAKVLGTKPKAWDILYRIKELTDGLKKRVEVIEDRVLRQPTKTTVQQAKYGVDWMIDFFGLRKGVSK